MQHQLVKYDKRGHVGCITLNRPRKGNALNSRMSEELADICIRINQDSDISAVILSGSGRDFCTGCEPREYDAASNASESIAGLERVSIAAIDGGAIDEGLELALACDIRIASDTTRFGLAHISRGHIPNAGGTQRLPRLIGQGKALELLLTAAIIDSQEALRIGLVNEVVAADELVRRVDEMANELSLKGPIALRYAKEAVYKGVEMSLAQGLRLEADLYFLTQTTSDRMEGIEAFKAKRTPRFRGE